jgi:hypothetical protein
LGGGVYIAKIKGNCFMKNSRPKDAIKAIKKRLLAPKDFKVVMFTLTVSVILDRLPNHSKKNSLKKKRVLFPCQNIQEYNCMT